MGTAMADAEPPPGVGPAAEPPRDLKSLRALIAGRRSSLPKRLVQVTEFATAQPEEIAFGTVATIAAKAHVQPSTLVRFAQALGYSGFSDLQAVFRAHARLRWQDYEQRLETLHEESSDEDPSALLRRFMDTSLVSVQRAMQTVDAESLRQSVELLARAETIHLLAARRSFPVTAYLAYALRNLAVRCELVDQVAGLAPEQVGLIAPRDAVVAISFTPYARATVEWAGLAARHQVPVLAITDSPFSPLVPTATAWLEVAEADCAGFRSLAATMGLAMTLAVAVARQRRK
jgi:DNA-binding MurR/RpiR family transcriptional regulator